MASSSNCNWTQKYPYPCHVNPSGFVSIKLSGTTYYHLWYEQITCLIESHGMQGFINGSFKSKPGEPNFDEWKRSDSLVKGWMFGSLSESVMAIVVGLDTAMGVWEKLNTTFLTPPPPASTAVTITKDLAEYLPLYRSIIKGDCWETTKEHLNKNNSALTGGICTPDNTALHVAIDDSKNIKIVENLLKMIDKNSLPSMVNVFGENPLHFAASVGNTTASNMLVKLNPHLLFISDKREFLPIHLSLFSSRRPNFVYFLEVSKKHIRISEQQGYHNPFEGRNGSLLLICVIARGFFDIAYELIKDYPDIARTKYNDTGTPLSCIVRKSEVYYSGTSYNFYQRFVYSYAPIDNIVGKEHDIENQKTYKDKVVSGCRRRRSCFTTVIQMIYVKIWEITLLQVPHIKRLKEDKVKHNTTLMLLKSICDEVSKLNRYIDMRGHYSDATIEAAINDTPEAFEEMLMCFPEAVWCYSNGYYIIQLAIMNRSEKVYNLLVHKMNTNKASQKSLKDKDGNNLLHLVAKLAPIHKLNLVSGAALQMQRELQWFHQVEKFLAREYREEKNTRQEKPIMVFRREHKELRKEGEEWIKKTADSYTITAALIITIVFAAAITVPGGNNGDTGKAIYLTNPSFIVFAVSDAISLFTSTTSLLLFLSVLTARYRDEDFLFNLPKRLIFGLVMLFLSVTSLMVAFSATLYIVFGQEKRWILIPIAALTCLPVASFTTLQFPLLVELISSTYGQGIFGKQND